MTAIITAIDGKLKDRIFKLSPGQNLSLGRIPACNVQILDKTLSREHCKFQWDGSKLKIIDLNSHNGTFLNGQRVKEVYLKSGDEIKIGQNKFKITIDKESITAEGSTGSCKTIEFVPEEEDIETETVIRERIKKDDILDIRELPKVYEEYEKALRDLTTIYKVGNIIHSESKLRLLFEKIIDIIFDVVKPDCVALLLLSEDQELEPALVKTNRPTEEGTAIKISRTIVNEALKKRTSVISSNAMMDKRFKETDSIIMRGIKSVMCAPIESLDKLLGLIYVDTQKEANAFSSRDLKLVSAIGNQAGIAIDRAKVYERLERFFLETVKTLVATIEAKDNYTRGHSERVTSYSLEIGTQLGLSDNELYTLKIVGLIHDIGKIGVPESILNKPGCLNEDEFAQIKLHPVRGAEIIKNIDNTQEIASAIKHHHEHWNGQGYPDGINDENIPLLSRIISVADAYDAMTSDRAYRERLTEEQAIKELKKWAGKQFDATVVNAFLKCSERKDIRRFDSIIWQYGEGKL